MLDRLNSSGSFRRRAVSPSTITSQAATNTMHALGKVPPTGVPASQNHRVNLVNQPSHNCPVPVLRSSIIMSMIQFSLELLVPFQTRAISSFVPAASSTSFLLPTNTQAVQCGIAYGNQSSLGLVSLQQEPFDICLHGSSNFLDHRCNENWTSTGIPKFPASSLRMTEATCLEDMGSSDFQDNISWSSSQTGNGAVNISSSMGGSAKPGDGRRNIQYQAGLSSNLVHGISQWHDQRQNYCQNASNLFSSTSMASEGDMIGQNSALGNNTANASLLGHFNGNSPHIAQKIKGENSVFDPKLSLGFAVKTSYFDLKEAVVCLPSMHASHSLFL